METTGSEIYIVFGVLIFLGMFLLLVCLPGIFYLITLHKAFARCRPRNRQMPPGLVWLMLIPFFNVIWHFVVVLNLATSLKKEFRARGIEAESAPGQALGISMCALNLTGAIPYLGIIGSIASFVCWICYWVKVADYSGQLAQEPWESMPDPAAENANHAYDPASKYRSNLYANRRERVAPDWR